MNNHVAAVLLSLFFVCANAPAQLIDHPVDTFERVRWDMGLDHLRAMSKDSSLTRMISPPGKMRGREKGLTYWRGERVFGQPQKVLYRLRALDSTLQQVAVMWVEAAADSAESSRAHDSLWVQIHRRYGPPTTTTSGGAERVWETSTSIIKAMRVKGLASGVVILANPIVRTR